MRAGDQLSCAVLLSWLVIVAACGHPTRDVSTYPSRPTETTEFQSRAEAERQQLWAEWQSRQTRSVQRAELEAADSSRVEELSARLVEEQRREFVRRHGMQAGDLEVLLAKGERERWSESSLCQVDSGAVYQVGLRGLPPEPLTSIEPRYTRGACEARIEGVVILQVVVGPQGLSGATVLKGIPFGLDQEAVRAAERVPWLPPLVCGKPATVARTITVAFRLPPAEEGC